MKKIFINLFCIFLFCNAVFSHDFKSSCGGGDAYLDIINYESKIIKGKTAWVKGTEFSLKGSHDSDTLYYSGKTTGPKYDEETETAYFKKEFIMQATLKKITKSASINVHVYKDNRAPVINLSDFTGDYVRIGNTFYSSTAFSFIFTVEKDLRDSGEEGSGLSVFSYSDNGYLTEINCTEEDYQEQFKFNFGRKKSVVTHVLNFTAEDKLGNKSTASYTIVLDKQIPVLTIKNLPSENVFYKSYTTECSADDGEGSGIDNTTWRVSSDGINFSPEGAPYSHITLSGSVEKNVVFKVNDRAGNTGTSLPFKINIDDVSPQIIPLEQTCAADGIWLSCLSAELPFKVSDDYSGVDFSTLRYSLDGGKTYFPFEKLNGNPSVTVTREGISYVVLKVSDYAGNEMCSSPVTCKIDRIAPLIETQDFDEKKYYSPLSLSCSVSDGESGVEASSVEYTLDGGKSWKTCVLNVSAHNTGALNASTLSFDEDGIYEVMFRARDNAGNIGVSRRLAVKIDSFVPECSILTDLSHWKNNTSGFWI